jgi:hypothetical protein
MRADSLQQYLSLRESLMRERNELQQRLNDINQVLGGEVPGPFKGGARGRGRKRSGVSLREAVMQVAKSPLTKEEILQRVQTLGYRFNTTNPLNSLGVILYGKNPRFHNEGGRFSVASGSDKRMRGGEIPKPVAERSRGRKGRRQMSPDARARIAAAARARWSKAKKGGKNRL